MAALITFSAFIMYHTSVKKHCI